MIYDLLIKNVLLVSSQGCVKGDLAISDEYIAAFGPSVEGRAVETLDGSGCWLVPGAVDAHTHLDLIAGTHHVCDGWRRGSIAALSGGTTCVMEHISFGPEKPLDKIDDAQAQASQNCLCDFAIHGVLQPGDVNSRLGRMLEEGKRRQVYSWKAYTTYDQALDAPKLRRMLLTCRQSGVLPAIHCEDDGRVNAARQRLAETGRLDPRWQNVSRPAAAEAVAIRQILELARELEDAPVYIVHLSSAAGAVEIARARQKGQANIYAETCPQYLFLDDSQYEGDEQRALDCVLSPPLRSPAGPVALWQALAEGQIDVIATDHCAFTRAQKRLGKDDLRLCPNGVPGVAQRLPLMLWASSQGRLSPQQVVELCCAAPARVFGVKSKGDLQVGYDADLVLYDPEAPPVVDLPADQPYDIYAGLITSGCIRHVWRRGAMVWSQGRLCLDTPGRLLARVGRKGV